MEELCMRDSNDLRQTYLYKLSEKPILQNFKNIAFLSSAQD